VAADYHYDEPPLLGTMRTGPDLFNIGVRQPSADWHLGHLFQPRAYVPGSTMPAYRFLFEIKKSEALARGERVVTLPPGTVRYDEVVVARPEALDLVAYLQGMKHDYPVLTAEQVQAASGRSQAADDSPTAVKTGARDGAEKQP
jgi:cytochrome c oxidase cbb3-type subunit 2